MQNIKFKTIEEYIFEQPENAKIALTTMRKIIADAAPGAEEVISYGMPAFKQDGILVFYAAWKNHIGFYPSGSGIKDFEAELATFKTSKGAIQFPLNQPLPIELIAKIVKFRVQENKHKAAIKALAAKKK